MLTEEQRAYNYYTLWSAALLSNFGVYSFPQNADIFSRRKLILATLVAVKTCSGGLMPVDDEAVYASADMTEDPDDLARTANAACLRGSETAVLLSLEGVNSQHFRNGIRNLLQRQVDARHVIASLALRTDLTNDKSKAEVYVADLLRDTTRPYCVDKKTFDDRWMNNPDVIRVAREIYEENTFDLYPLLGDALIDAGCPEENELVMSCRGWTRTAPGCGRGEKDGIWFKRTWKPFRGEWMLDVILGKK